MSQTAQPKQRGTRPEDRGESVSDTDFSPDDAFEVLNNHRRRYALHHLKRNGPEANIGELSEHIASWENGTGVAEVGSAQRKRVYTSLQQFHLPKLDEKGIIEYDERQGRAALTDEADKIDMYLEVVYESDIPWSEYYLGLAAVNAVVAIAMLTNLGPFGMLQDVALVAFIITSLTISAVAHVYHDMSHRLGANEKPPTAKNQ
jgi:hypothetical protein